MNKKYMLFGFTIIVLVVGIVWYTSNSSKKPSPPADENTTEIIMSASGFSPSLVNIRSGEVVRFQNSDTSPHWPASNPHPAHTDYPGFDALHPVAPGQSYSFKFIKVGSFGFHDHLNPGLTGQVVVEPAPGSTQDENKKLIEATPLRIGNITWHPKNFIDKEVFLVGYVLKKEKDYDIFSDEAGGAITSHDLPVSGTGVDQLVLKQKYTITGIFRYKGLSASNGSAYHLELSATPTLVK